MNAITSQTLSFPPCLVSGGQTGADRAGLDFAIAHGLSHAGYCPAGRRAEDGPISGHYNLTETATADYPERTRKNVRLGDATLIFSTRPLVALQRIQRGSGSALTVRECERQNRPFLVLSHFPNAAADAAELKEFLTAHTPRVLNIAGSSETRTPGIYSHVLSVLSAVAAVMPQAVDASTYPTP